MTAQPLLKIFNDVDVDQALEKCQTAGYQTLFMPELADNYVRETISRKPWYTTPSTGITGKTRQGSKVVVYSHIPTSFATPEGIRAAKQQGLVNGAGCFSQQEFQSLVDADGQTDAQGDRRVWVVDYDILRKAGTGKIDISTALEHPQVIPFLCGVDRASIFLTSYAVTNNTTQIGVRNHSDFDDRFPLARLLYLGVIDDNSLYGDCSLDISGQFLGVRQTSAEDTQTLEESIEDIGNRYARELERLMKQRGYSR